MRQMPVTLNRRNKVSKTVTGKYVNDPQGNVK